MQRIYVCAKRHTLLNIVFLARSLEVGGAERQLVVLAKGLRAAGNRVQVAIFYMGEPFDEVLREAGVHVHQLHKRGRWDVVGFLIRLVRFLRQARPQIIHGYLGVPNIVLALVVPFVRPARLVWGLRTSSIDTSPYDWVHRLVYRVEARLSRVADLIIMNSEAGSRHAVAVGFIARRVAVIPNGIDVLQFRPINEARERVRHRWSAPEAHKVIGIVARLDPLKDHKTFLRAAAMLVEERSDVLFVCAGDGSESYREELKALSRKLGIVERVIWERGNSNIVEIYNGLDLACSASVTEGFPNAVAEAMACGVPCVVTDVGDSAQIVGGTGIAVPPRDPVVLANGMNHMLRRIDVEGSALAHVARERVVENFAVERLIERTASALQALL